MRVITELEAKDIDPNDPINRMLISTLAMCTLIVATSQELKDKAINGSDAELAEAWKPTIAMFRNMLNRAGFSIVKEEEIPSAFKSAFNQ